MEHGASAERLGVSVVMECHDELLHAIAKLIVCRKHESSEDFDLAFERLIFALSADTGLPHHDLREELRHRAEAHRSSVPAPQGFDALEQRSP